MRDNIAVLTSKESWFLPYARQYVKHLNSLGRQAELFYDHREISGNFSIVFMISYFQLVGKEYLDRHEHNLVVHESDLPKGRGWAPLFWQILEGKRRIPIVLFEAREGADDGPVYIREYIDYCGHELHDELRAKQAEATLRMCTSFLAQADNLRPTEQSGNPTYYARRTPKDSELSLEKTLGAQFNLLRIVHNEEFPAFFYNGTVKYIVKIYREE